MLYFLRKPDAMFIAILHRALESEGESIQGCEGVDSWEACYPTDAYGASPEARHSADELHMTPIEPSLWDEQGPKEGLFTSRSLRYPEKGDRGSRGD